MTTSSDFELRPRREHARRPFLRIGLDNYFASGGVCLTDGMVTVRRMYARQKQRVAAADVSSLVLAKSQLRGGDWRLLLLDRQPRVLAWDTADFYSDEDLHRLAAALQCPLETKDVRSWAELDRGYPGSAHGLVERHPVGAVFGITAILSCVGAVAVVLAHLL